MDQGLKLQHQGIGENKDIVENISTNYRLVKKIKDDKFDVEGLHHYDLAIQLSDNDFQLCISDSRSTSCLLLEDYILNDTDSIEELIKTLSQLFENHHLLHAGFWNSVKFIIKNINFTLVPSSLFDKDQLADYLKLSCDVNPDNENIHYYKHIKTDAVAVFSANKKFSDWLSSLYPNSTVHVIHQGNALIEGVLNYEDHDSGKSMYLFTDRNHLSIIITNNRKLEFYNKFPINTTSDYFKYVASAFQLYELDQQHSKVIVWGNINKESPHFKELYKYFKHVSFGYKPKFLRFNYMFDEVDDHQYFDLYNTFLCE